MRFVILITLFLSDICFANPIEVEERTLTHEESKLIEKIKKYYPDFVAGNKVRTYYQNSDNRKTKIPLYSEMTFSEEEGLIGGIYIGYSVTFKFDPHVLAFEFDAGTAFRGYGSIVVAEDKVVKTEFVCGTSSCSLTTYVNGKEISLQLPQEKHNKSVNSQP